MNLIDAWVHLDYTAYNCVSSEANYELMPLIAISYDINLNIKYPFPNDINDMKYCILDSCLSWLKSSVLWLT